MTNSRSKKELEQAGSDKRSGTPRHVY